ncbi:MAG TPA: MFS transporter [Streptosporangiaceae bacterium]|nr:MFS transporter [Streptosporangiaceae bacterium]
MKTMAPETIQARRWATLAVLCLSLLLVVVDSSIVNVALPTLSRALHASTTSLQWITDAYTLAVAGLLLTLGSMGDRIGRHRLLAAGLATFGLGSALAGLAGSAGQLIAFRVLMGIGAAAIMPATLSILTNVFTNPAERAKAIGAWAAVAGLGVAIGPSTGGWLLEHFAWGSIFMVNLPIVAVALVAGRFVVPPSASPHPKPLDPAGAVLSVAGLLAVVYAIIEAPGHGWLSASTLGTAGAGLVILAAWAVVELRSSHPMVDLHVFANARFSAASFSVTMIFFALFGWLFLFTQQMQFVLGYSALQAGARTLPFALAMGVTSATSARLTARIGTKLAVAAGLAFMAAGFGLMATSTVHTGYPFLALASVILAIGMGLAMAPATESIMGSLPPAQAGVGSAVNDTTREIGGAIGVAVMGSAASSVFASHLHASLAHLPARYAHAATSLANVLTAARQAHGPAGQALAHAAQHAFVTGSNTALLAAIAAALLGSLAAVIFLPARAGQSVTHTITTPATRPAPATQPAPGPRELATTGRPA